MNESKESQFQYIRYSILGTILIFLLFQVSGLLFSNLSFGNKILQPYLQGFTQIVFMLLPTLFLANRTALGLKNLLRINPNINQFQIIYAFLGVIGLQLISSSWMPIQDQLIPSELMNSYNEIRELISKQYSDIISGSGMYNLILSIIVAAIIPAFTEEFLFRGFLQHSLEQRLRPYTAIMVTSIIFALFHFNPVNIIPLFIIGIYLGIVAYTSQSIYLSLFIHFTYNAILVILIYTASGTSEMENGEELDLIAAIPMFVFGLASVGLSVIMILKNKIGLTVNSHS
jgi:uncharacterized protein